MVEALWYEPSGWLEGLRLLWGRFQGKWAIGSMSPFPVADSPETTAPAPGSVRLLLAPLGMHQERRPKRPARIDKIPGEGISQVVCT